MKKYFRIFIAVLTITTLIFSMSAFAYADTQTAVKPTVEKTGHEDPVTASYSYDQTSILETENYSTVVGLVVPVTVSKAGVIEVGIKINRLEKNMKVEIYTDEACTNRLTDYYTYITEGDTEDTGYAKVSGAGTYYLKFSTDNYDKEAVFANTFDLSLCQWTADPITVKSGKTIRLYNYYPKQYRDFKFKATKNGKITVSHNSNYGYHAQILNAKKKELSDKQWCDEGVSREKCQFAVQKGKTYYIRIYPNDSGSKYHEFKIKEAEVKEKSGTKRSKAVTIKAKKKVNGTIVAGSKQADWYKFKLSKKKKLTITVSGQASTYLNFTVYNSKGKEISTKSLYGSGSMDIEVTNSTTYGKANKGTYYIKVSRKSSKDSGIYKLSWR